MTRPNVILLTVDSLRWDRLGVNGYARPVTPEIDAMTANALLCDSTYTLSSCTIGAFPTLMTSSRPLSYGGFDCGLSGRPPSLSVALSDAGYKVAHISTVHWVSSFSGYSEGVSYEEILSSLPAVARMPSVLLRSSFKKYTAGNMRLSELKSEVDRILPKFFDDLRRYCAIRRQQQTSAIAEKLQNSDYGAEKYRWDSVERGITCCAEEYKGDKSRFIERAVREFNNNRKWGLDKAWRFEREWMQIFNYILRRGACTMLKPVNPMTASRLLHPTKWYIDAEALMDKVLTVADRLKSSSSPYFIWTHLFDCHIPFACGSGRNWVRDASNWLRQVGHKPSINPMISRGPKPTTPEQWASWCALYDAAVRFIDHHIGRLRRRLEEIGHANTLIVLTSDHGEEFGEHGECSHKFRLYEHNTHVNCIYYHPDFRNRSVPGLSTLMDVAPTITDLVSAPKQTGWEGESLRDLQANPRHSIVLETFYGSPCDFTNRPLYMAARQGSFKLLFTERVDPQDSSSRPGIQLFDLQTDPNEVNDIAAQYPRVVDSLMRPIRSRLTELRNEPDADPIPEQTEPESFAAA